MPTEPTCASCRHMRPYPPGRPGIPPHTSLGWCSIWQSWKPYGTLVSVAWGIEAKGYPPPSACPHFCARSPLARLRSLQSEAERHIDELAQGPETPDTLDAVGPFRRVAEFLRQEISKLEGR